jgi:hypothetical protein
VKINSYFLLLLGESRSDVESLHRSSISRLKAYAIAMHIPLFIWVGTGFLVAARIFQLSADAAVGVAMCAGLLVYLVERVVLATPKGWIITVLRLLLGLLMAVVGSAMVDLVLFDREIAIKLQREAEHQLEAQQQMLLHTQAERVEEARTLWLSSKAAANCEANGTCGSGIRSTGPIYRELVAQAEIARADYLQAAAKLESLEKSTQKELQTLREHGVETSKIGVLARLEALHDYILNTKIAGLVWLVFCSLIVLMELMVVFVKIVFPATADDLICEINEAVSAQKARDYRAAVISPLFGARQLLRSENG